MPLPPLVEPVVRLSDAERLRTVRHAALAGFGELAQRRLAAAHIAIVGAGGLGSPAILALSAAGVGTISVIDDDVVDAGNLQRQVLHGLTDVGSPKTASAVRAAAALSPETVVNEVRERLTAENAVRLLGGADVVIDGSDTFTTRAAVAGACEALGVPLVWGVVQEFHAQVTVFWSAPPEGTEPAHLADLYPPETVGELPTCAAVGVLGALCVQVGGMLASEAIKLVAGIGEPLLGRVAVIDALRARVSEVLLRPTEVTAQPTTRAEAPGAVCEVTAQELLAAQSDGAMVLDVREPWETASGVIEGSTLLPLGDLLADPGRIAADEVVVVCALGLRAHRAAAALSGRGARASVLAGGLDAWRDQL